MFEVRYPMLYKNWQEIGAWLEETMPGGRNIKWKTRCPDGEAFIDFEDEEDALSFLLRFG